METIVVPPPTEEKAFEGSLAVLPLAELLQFIHISAKDGVLVVNDDGGRPRAVIHYVKADIVHAMCDGIGGREAVFAAMQHTTGHFEFFTGHMEHVVRTITDGVQNLILEGLRRIDELSHMARLLPADDHPLHLAPVPPHDDIRLTAREWRILSLVNSKRGVGQIVEIAGGDPGDVRAALVGLITADLIVDHRDDSYLDAIVPRALRQDEVRVTRYAPPTLVANLLVKRCNGTRSMRDLMEDLRMDERQLLEELKLLVRTHWLTLAAGEEAFRRLAEE